MQFLLTWFLGASMRKFRRGPVVEDEDWIKRLPAPSKWPWPEVRTVDDLIFRIRNTGMSIQSFLNSDLYDRYHAEIPAIQELRKLFPQR